MEHLWTDNNEVKKGTWRNRTAWTLEAGERFKNLLTFQFNVSVYTVAAYYKPQRNKSTKLGARLARLSRYEYDTFRNRLLRTDAVLECNRGKRPSMDVPFVRKTR